jgi:hypothetical protein
MSIRILHAFFDVSVLHYDLQALIWNADREI